MQNLEQKYEKLQRLILEMGSVVVAFSAGVDSTFLLKVAHDLLGDRVLAVTSTSAIRPVETLKEAKDLAISIGVEHRVIQSKELEKEEFVSNDPQRCYYCKKELFEGIWDVAKAEGLNCVVEGSNFDDLDDFRPGMKAIKELQVRSPLLEAELTKEEIRELSKRLNLPTWNKPAFACLATRFPYGERLVADKLTKVGKAEGYLRQFNFKQLRVRHHDDLTARIEVLPEDMPFFLEHRLEVVARFKEVGYNYIALDLMGYRTGSMNEVLEEEVKVNG